MGEEILEALIEAIERGDKERAKRLAYSLFRNPPRRVSRETFERLNNPETWEKLVFWGLVGLFVLSMVVSAFGTLSRWFSKPREEVRRVV